MSRPTWPICGSCGKESAEARPFGWLRVKVQLTGISVDEASQLQGRTKYFCTKRCFKHWVRMESGFDGLFSEWWKLLTALGRTRTPVNEEKGKVR